MDHNWQIATTLINIRGKMRLRGIKTTNNQGAECNQIYQTMGIVVYQ